MRFSRSPCSSVPQPQSIKNTSVSHTAAQSDVSLHYGKSGYCIIHLLQVLRSGPKWVISTNFSHVRFTYWDWKNKRRLHLIYFSLFFFLLYMRHLLMKKTTLAINMCGSLAWISVTAMMSHRSLILCFVKWGENKINQMLVYLIIHLDDWRFIALVTHAMPLQFFPATSLAIGMHFNKMVRKIVLYNMPGRKWNIDDVMHKTERESKAL